jgi:hypothetical protein
VFKLRRCYSPLVFLQNTEGAVFFNALNFYSMEIFTIEEMLEIKANIENMDVSYEPDRQELKDSLLQKIYNELRLRERQHSEDYPIVIGEGKSQIWIF